ncbi:MAG: SPASM domain-containing protein [Alphaproteobacteria bacterium]|nr:SPASM domain-containing protein [Alphaproteobacteria bacterium]
MTKVVSTPKQPHFREYGFAGERGKSLEQRPEYQAYRKAWFEYPERKIVPNFPINLDLHITNKCNLECDFCPRTWHDKAGGFEEYGFMPMDLYRRVIDEAVAEGMAAVHFTANGEPLLHKGLEEMITYARDKGVLDLRMHTNAVGLSEKRARGLLQSGLHNLAISFDSPVKETYEQLRKGSNFEKTLENIRRFVQLRDEMGLEFPLVRVQMVDQTANKDERKMFDELFMNIADTVSHVYYIPYNGGPGSYIPERKDEADRTVGQRCLTDDFSCSYLWQRLIVEWDGTVYPCFFGFDLVVGNLKTQTLKEIWHGEPMQELRRLHAAGEFAKNPHCAGCGRQYETKENTSDRF